MLGQKDVNDLKAQSLKEYLQCYTSSSPSTLREMLSQDVSAAVEDITCKFFDVYHGYSCSRAGQPKPIANDSNKVLSVRIVCVVYHVNTGTLCCMQSNRCYTMFGLFCRSLKN